MTFAEATDTARAGADDAAVAIGGAEAGAEEAGEAAHGTAAFDATGDPTVMPSWDELVREHADRVYRLAYRLSGNVHDAEDLTQDTFIRVFRSLSSYRAGTFEGWLHRITTNLFLDMVRRRNRIRMEALPDDYDRVPADTPDPEQIYHDARLAPDLQRALAALAPEFRAAVVLCDVEGLSYEEIAATLGVKLGTVRSRIHRGRQAIRDRLAQVSEDHEAGAGFPAAADSGRAGPDHRGRPGTDGPRDSALGAGLAGVDGPAPAGSATHGANRRRRL